ncbi:MAG: RcnB family protein [Polaromonas sp.]
MKSKILTTTLTVLALALGGVAMAKDKGDDHDNGHGKKKGWHKVHREDRDERGEHENRGAGPDHNFYRGGRLPVQYRDRGYWVDDWRGHRLTAPPPGYHWVQTGADYVLVANNTGTIFQIFLGR